MRILVTGANGQLGNEMQVLAKENPQHTYYFTDVQELDICDKQAVWTYMAEKQIELVVNCAAYTAVDKAEDNQELAYKLNCEAPKQLASAAQANGAAMIQVSTDYVFDGTAHTPYTEDCNPCPDSVYGTTKLEGEKEVMNHCEQAVVIPADKYQYPVAHVCSPNRKKKIPYPPLLSALLHKKKISLPHPMLACKMPSTLYNRQSLSAVSIFCLL